MSASAAIERRLQAIQLHLSPAGTLAVQHMERADTSSGQQSLWQDIPEVLSTDCCLKPMAGPSSQSTCMHLSGTFHAHSPQRWILFGTQV